VDCVAHFGREVTAFETAARAGLGAQPAPAVPSCPGWQVTNLALHLGTVHRYVARVIAERLPEPPLEQDLAWLAAPGRARSWQRATGPGWTAISSWSRPSSHADPFATGECHGWRNHHIRLSWLAQPSHSFVMAGATMTNETRGAGRGLGGGPGGARAQAKERA
jgi:hypothetical protein